MGKLITTTTTTTTTHLLFCTLCITLVLHASPATSQEVEDEHEFSYDMTSENGPLNWWRVHPEEWSHCGGNNNTMQSPIDLLDEKVDRVTHLGKLKKSYRSATATLKNRGHDMMLKFEGEDGAGYIRLNGKNYTLQQLHWHSPSEHTLNGKKFALELHLVHMSSDGEIAVIGIMYKLGRPDSFLWELRHDLRDVSGSEEQEKPVGVINPKLVKFGSRKYYRYIGSLTTPPCTPGVTWTIVRKIRTVSREQVRLLRVAVHDESDSNARPTQKIHNRTVSLYRPQDHEGEEKA